jgi:hypothetical protein
MKEKMDQRSDSNEWPTFEVVWECNWQCVSRLLFFKLIFYIFKLL